MLFIFRTIIAYFLRFRNKPNLPTSTAIATIQTIEAPVVEEPKQNTVITLTEKPYKKPDYFAFMQHIEEKTGLSYKYKIIRQNILEYGELPHLFIIAYDINADVFYMSFFQGSDPMFAAAMFSHAKEFFAKALLSECFLYRADGSLALALDDDYHEILAHYINNLTTQAKTDTVKTPKLSLDITTDLYSNKNKYKIN